MQSPEIPTSPLKWSVTNSPLFPETAVVFKTSCHASHQATIPVAQQDRQISCHAYHYFPISDAKDFHASCLNIQKHRYSVAALPEASGPLVALLPRSPSGI
jgi:hypothetical protein